MVKARVLVLATVFSGICVVGALLSGIVSAAVYPTCEGQQTHPPPSFCDNMQDCRATGQCLDDISHQCSDGSCDAAPEATCRYTLYSETKQFGNCTGSSHYNWQCQSCQKWWCAKGTKYRERTPGGACDGVACDVVFAKQNVCNATVIQQ